MLRRGVRLALRPACWARPYRLLSSSSHRVAAADVCTDRWVGGVGSDWVTAGNWCKNVARKLSSGSTGDANLMSLSASLRHSFDNNAGGSPGDGGT